MVSRASRLPRGPYLGHTSGSALRLALCCNSCGNGPRLTRAPRHHHIWSPFFAIWDWHEAIWICRGRDRVAGRGKTVRRACCSPAPHGCAFRCFFRLDSQCHLTADRPRGTMGKRHVDWGSIDSLKQQCASRQCVNVRLPCFDPVRVQMNMLGRLSTQINGKLPLCDVQNDRSELHQESR